MHAYIFVLQFTNFHSADYLSNTYTDRCFFQPRVGGIRNKRMQQYASTLVVRNGGVNTNERHIILDSSEGNCVHRELSTSCKCQLLNLM